MDTVHPYTRFSELIDEEDDQGIVELLEDVYIEDVLTGEDHAEVSYYTNNDLKASKESIDPSRFDIGWMDFGLTRGEYHVDLRANYTDYAFRKSDPDVLVEVRVIYKGSIRIGPDTTSVDATVLVLPVAY